jgi:uncharacterized protein (DUF2141 family)
MTLLALTLLLTQTPWSLTVTVTGVDPKRQGTLICALFTAEKGFPLEPVHASKVVAVRVTASTHDCVFELDGPAVVAISVGHDENGNRRVDRNLFGVPLEGWATTNDVKPLLRPPTFAESQVAVSPTKNSLTVTTHY